MEPDSMENSPFSQNPQVAPQSVPYSGFDMQFGASSSSHTTTPAPEINIFSELEKRLEGFTETARYIGIIASDFHVKNQDSLNAQIYELVIGLQDLDRMKNAFEDVKVPLELLNFLDEGKNPQMYSREILERTVKKNKEVNGKIEIYKKFRAHLLGAFANEMPDMVLQYRDLREKPEEE